MEITKELVGKRILFTLLEYSQPLAGNEVIYEGLINAISPDERFVRIFTYIPKHQERWYEASKINILSIWRDEEGKEDELTL